ncbi:MAG: hypothetical protein MUF49_32620 [Oculatellaceae cyanobacterium Prado106]|jgi:polyhydroxyalkanoate synthesis regulator phasin|nr:hypothetical protein [Oculatellaceae cyanobacterium Prado106]
MNPDTLIQNLQKGYRVTIGATASLIESIQDPQLREENFNKLRHEPNQLIEELAVKGETTEQDARKFVDGMFGQSSWNQGSSTGTTVPTTATPVTSPDIQQDLQELTAQIAALRMELERLRSQNP